MDFTWECPDCGLDSDRSTQFDNNGYFEEDTYCENCGTHVHIIAETIVDVTVLKQDE